MSNMADGVLVVGAPLVAIGITRSPLLVALTSTLAMAPWLGAPLLAGALADRHDRRIIIIGAAWIRAIVLAVGAIAAAVNAIPLYVLYGLVLLVGVSEVFADTTTQSLLPMLVPRERLEAANGRIISAQKITAELLGSPIAGALVAVNAAILFGATAAVYTIVGIGLLSLPGTYVADRPDRGARLTSEIKEGIRFLRSSRLLTSLAVLAGLLNLAASAYLAVFVLWAVGEDSAMGLQPPTYGMLLALAGVGGALGALVVEPVAARIGEVRALLGSASLAALLLVVPVAAPTFTAAGPAILVVGVCSAITNVTIVSMRQRLIPNDLLGRVNATYRLVGMGTMPIGALLGGLAAEHAGIAPVLLATAALSLLAILTATKNVRSDAVADAER